MILMGFLPSFALENSVESSVLTELKQIPLDNNNDKNDKRRDDSGRRAPSRPIPCSIDATDGVRLLDGDTPDFIYYEIADCNGNIVFATGDETAFIENLLSLSGTYTILLTDDLYSYTGVVDLY